MDNPRKPVLLDQIPQKSISAKLGTMPQIQCWVPECDSTSDHFLKKTFYSLPADPVLRDFWLAAAGRKFDFSLQNIWFCERHFHIDREGVLANFPVYHMPKKICRTCLVTIEDKKYAVLNYNIKSTMPNCVQQIFGNTSTVPLLEVLQFCTSEMTITTNPIPVTCTNCYRNIWIYYLFKKKCMYKEKAIEEEYNPGSYGNFVGCRACSTTNYTNVISLNENTELGRLLNSMFTKYYPSSFVPLGLCPSCESTLKEIQVFRRVLSLANQYFEQHQENLLHSQVSQDKPVVALKEGRLKGTELDDIISEYLKAEPPTPTNKPLKKRYRSPLSTSASTSRDPVIQHILTGDVIPIRRHPEPMGIFEPNMIPPPSYNSIVPPPPYSLSTMCGSSTSTATCSAFDAKTGVRSTVENRAAAQEYQYQASYSGILSNQDHLKLEKVAGNVRKAPINTIPVIQSAILKSSMIIDLTEEEDKMVQVANISSSWEDQSPEGAGAHVEPDSETAKGNSVHAGGSTVNSVGKEASSSQMEMSDTGPGKQTSLKNEVDREHKNASHNWWTREKDMIFLDALTAQFKQANARSLIQIWRNLKNENLLSSKKATTLASHWYDLKKNYNKKSLDRGLSEKVSHCMKLFDQLDAIKNSVRASKQPDDENSVILVRKMTNFLHESDIFDVTWNVVLRKMSSCDKFAGYNYLNLKVQWQNLFRRLKTRTGGTALSNDLKEELDSLMGLMKKLKLRNYWHTELAPKKAESPWFGSKKKRRAMSKNVGKPQQCFSFQDKVDLLEAMKNEYEVSRSKATLAANPWRTLIIKVKSHRTKYDTWDESRLLRMWSQMKVS
ncbi:unnamed protein product [Acanthoscelides obtectus]|uniref:THAP-type domain-containing protein n=1 Tax=Acanthoscelides obtectus TaxID=200917 RepID=A0A9P0M9M8_ACAOB|nr:unnamed protein product [Acanthoscelides obtectus]CAK1649206.1 hypothetical protein AOBTE_LOCUS16096 [Acanthoscelides obtectus]